MITQLAQALCILSLRAGRHNLRPRVLWNLRVGSQPAECPLSMLGNDCVVRGGKLRKPGANFLVTWLSRAQPGIPHRDAGVSDEAFPLRALYRTAAKYFAKLFFGERDQPFQVR